MSDQHEPDHPTDQPTGEPWEREMSSEFDRRVRDLHEAPLTLDHVKGTAMTIRRRRRAAVAGGILAAAAVIVPVAVVAGNADGDSDTGPAPAGSPSATPTSATDSPTSAPPDGPAAPLPSYVEGASFHRADGSVYELPAATYREAVALGDRVVAYRYDDQAGTGVVDVVSDGAVVDTYLAPLDFVADPAGGVVAFVTGTGRVQTLWDGGARVLAEGYAGWSARAVTGGPDCLDPEAGGSGCRVFLKDDGPDGGTTAVDSHGIEEPPAGDARVIYDADGAGRLTVVGTVTDDGSCGGVYDEGTSAYVVDQCEHTLRRFSPDGTLVLGGPAYGDGLGDGYAVVVDATTGAEVARLEPEDGFVGTTVWLDDATVAAQVYDYGEQSWSIQTLTLAGGGDGADAEPVTVVGPTPGADTEPPFHLVP